MVQVLFVTFSAIAITNSYARVYNFIPPISTPPHICRHSDCHSRPTFEHLTRELDRDSEALLSWSEQDNAVSSKAIVLGAPLEAGKHLYQERQETYKT